MNYKKIYDAAKVAVAYNNLFNPEKSHIYFKPISDDITKYFNHAYDVDLSGEKQTSVPITSNKTIVFITGDGENFCDANTFLETICINGKFSIIVFIDKILKCEGDDLLCQMIFNMFKYIIDFIMPDFQDRWASSYMKLRTAAPFILTVKFANDIFFTDLTKDAEKEIYSRVLGFADQKHIDLILDNSIEDLIEYGGYSDYV